MHRFVLLLLTAGVQHTFYVSPAGRDTNPGTRRLPFQSLVRARDGVAALNKKMTGDVVVYLRSGSYPLSEPVTFTARDGGSNGHDVVYAAYPGETPGLTGGRAVTGWTPAGDGLYRASLAPLGAGFRTRQLYVNGRRATWARTPDAEGWPSPGLAHTLTSWDPAQKRVSVDASEVKGLGSALTGGKAEIVIERYNRFDIYPIESTEARSASDAWINVRRIYKEPPKSRLCHYFFQGAREFLDTEGEWAIDGDRNEILYKPRRGEDMSTAVVVVPVSDGLIRVEGTLDDPVSHLRFEGLRFEHTTWLHTDGKGFVDGGESYYWLDRYFVIPAAVRVKNARSVRFARNVFRHLGAGGISFVSGVQDGAIAGNVFSDIAAHGIYVSESHISEKTDRRAVCKNVLIENNYITGAAADYRGSYGIDASHTDGLSIVHNEIEDLPYAGIWMAQEHPEYLPFIKENALRNNKVHDVSKLFCHCGGGVTVKGHLPDSKVSENYIYNVTRMPWAASYQEEYDHTYGMVLMSAKALAVENNVFENNDVDLLPLWSSGNTLVNFTGTKTNTKSAPNNAYTTAGALDTAAVKAKAGLEPAYLAIKKLAQEGRR